MGGDTDDLQMNGGSLLRYTGKTITSSGMKQQEEDYWEPSRNCLLLKKRFQEMQQELKFYLQLELCYFKEKEILATSVEELKPSVEELQQENGALQLKEDGADLKEISTGVEDEVPEPVQPARIPAEQVLNGDDEGSEEGNGIRVEYGVVPVGVIFQGLNEEESLKWETEYAKFASIFGEDPDSVLEILASSYNVCVATLEIEDVRKKEVVDLSELVDDQDLISSVVTTGMNLEESVKSATDELLDHLIDSASTKN